MADFGYDVADYCDIDPLFGNLDGFDRLLTEAHQRGFKVLLDWVPNHTSDRHPWFLESRSSLNSEKRDWYWWRPDRTDAEGGSGPPGSPGRQPNNWLSAFTGVGQDSFPAAWTRDEGSAEWYLHLFLAEQPDLRWTTPAVREAMAGVMRFWLDRGVDGFRIDVIQALAKPEGLPDLPVDTAAVPVCAVLDEPSVHPLIQGIRSVVDGYSDPDRVIVGETLLPTVAQLPPYYGSADHPELHLAFNFRPLQTRWDSGAWRRRIDEAEGILVGSGCWPTWFLSNHDNPRHRTRYGSAPRARAAAVLLLTLRGTPFLYAGEELGLSDAVVTRDQEVDPGGRDGCRAPIPWDPSPAHGWAGGPKAWLPWPPEAESGDDHASQRLNEHSTLHLYRTLVAVRKRSPALRRGEFEWLESSAGALAFQRVEGDDQRVVVVNFGTEQARAELPAGDWTVEVSSRAEPLLGDPSRAERYRGEFPAGADEAAVLTRLP